MIKKIYLYIRPFGHNASQREFYQLVSKRLSSALLWIDHHHSLHRFVELLLVVVSTRVQAHPKLESLFPFSAGDIQPTDGLLFAQPTPECRLYLSYSLSFRFRVSNFAISKKLCIFATP